MIINQHYLDRYLKLIINSFDDNVDEGEMHHIVPRCMGGDDSKGNLIFLSHRKHFIAHWLLYLAFPDNEKVTYAFYSMCNKNSKIPKKSKYYKKILNSRTYELLKKRAIEKLSRFHKGKVSVIDENGMRTYITSEEYKHNKEKYNFHTRGKVWCKDTETGDMVYITTDLYHSDDRYVKEVRSWKESNPTIVVILEGEEKKVTYDEYLELRSSDSKIKCKFYGNLDNYKGTLVAYSKTEEKYIKVPVEDYYLNPDEYITSTKGKVLAKDVQSGEYQLIEIDKFKSSNNYVGQTKGLTTVFSKKENKYIQIPVEDFDRNIHNGPCLGKINVVQIEDGKRVQIPKSEFDQKKHISLGNNSIYFRCKNKLSLKEKNITIVEWVRNASVSKQWEILDQERFEKAQSFFTKYLKDVKLQ